MPAKRSTPASGSGLAAVAERAGVSLATASRVLTASNHRVSRDLRERVLHAAEALDYVPNASARSLSVGMRKIVGVLLCDMVDSQSYDYIRALEEFADSAGWLIMLANASRDVEKEFRYLRVFRAERVGAIILDGSGLDDEYRARLNRELGSYVKHGGRVVMSARHGLPFTEFVPDNVGGAKAACEHLLERGHRRIGIITGPRATTGTTERVLGAKKAFEARRIAWDESLVVEGDSRRTSGVAGCEHLLSRAPDLTAIFAMSDDMASGVYEAASAHGLRIPMDLSVIGYSDVGIARVLSPPLTTVSYPSAELARRAIEACVGEVAFERMHVVVPSELIVRKSVAAPRETSVETA
jgi:LacI family transcriptional regulator